MEPDLPFEPYRIKVVERIHRVPRAEREQHLREAEYNIFRIPSAAIYIDLLTDSGTAAMSDRQWAAMVTGDEAYAQSRSWDEFERTIRHLTGYRHVIPCHQGRAAENLLCGVLLEERHVVPNNTHFDTTRANVEFRGAVALDCVCDEGLDPDSDAPFKGNLSVAKLEAAFARYGDRIPFVMMTITNNSGGGQPVSLANVRETAAVCHAHGVPLFLDCARFAENAWFIKRRERGQADRTIEAIAQEFFRHADGCLMSAKKDALVNIGGFIALTDDKLAERLAERLIVQEGFPTYGGLAGRDLAAVAEGLREVLDEEYLTYRIGQVARLGERLAAHGVPFLKPAGGHAIYLDARAILPHVPPRRFPGVSFTAALYLEAGIRACEIGSLMFEHVDPDSGALVSPAMELVRLAVPRRVYTHTQLDYVADACARVRDLGDRLQGLEIVWQPPALRHFLCRLRPIGGGRLIAS
ncbi:MAG TPA: tryptophanase [Candidatus Krumholzibacteria bacterium]|nr:tryptophanase [Candidatus Krumholzibacteria bacterium]HPD71392.1 tryptophanase [Candidatus Krumholzibacteria bacterium]HRY38908.1 tryptophanase [Candidatus Krumholzibacteria bacterium]